jgi:hypothetical protein
MESLVEKNKLEKSRVCILIFLFILIFSGTSSMLCKAQHKAYLPTGVPKTGVSKSYHRGDDGDLRRGIKWPNPRFVDNHNGTITDRLTWLMWQKAPGNKRVEWVDAFKRIADINKRKLGGHSDWRLPNILELRSLSNMKKLKDINDLYLKKSGFEITLGNHVFWSATSCIKFHSDVFYFFSTNAYEYDSKSGMIYSADKRAYPLIHSVLAVRGGFK